MTGIIFSESDFVNLQLSKCDESIVYDFLKVINNETLGRKVSIALNQRQQGNFDKAMLNITEANRDQVLAVREIQSILDELTGRSKSEVVFEKYRQILPFQIGITNGEQVLNLLNEFESVFDGRLSRTIGELHNNEKEVCSQIEEFTFFSKRMKGKISENELEEMQKSVLNLSEISCIFSGVNRNSLMSLSTLLINKTGLVGLLMREFHSGGALTGRSRGV